MCSVINASCHHDMLIVEGTISKKLPLFSILAMAKVNVSNKPDNVKCILRIDITDGYGLMAVS